VTAQTPSPAQTALCYPLGHSDPEASQNPHCLFQIVDTLKFSETTVNTALTVDTHQTNRTLVISGAKAPRISIIYGPTKSRALIQSQAFQEGLKPCLSFREFFDGYGLSPGINNR
jgi:hypothetical protein